MLCTMMIEVSAIDFLRPPIHASSLSIAVSHVNSSCLGWTYYSTCNAHW